MVTQELFRLTMENYKRLLIEMKKKRNDFLINHSTFSRIDY
jgi:hypothetical protein